MSLWRGSVWTSSFRGDFLNCLDSAYVSHWVAFITLLLVIIKRNISKQYRSRSECSFRSPLIWIFTVCCTKINWLMSFISFQSIGIFSRTFIIGKLIYLMNWIPNTDMNGLTSIAYFVGLTSYWCRTGKVFFIGLQHYADELTMEGRGNELC